MSAASLKSSSREETEQQVTVGRQDLILILQPFRPIERTGSIVICGVILKRFIFLVNPTGKTELSFIIRCRDRYQFIFQITDNGVFPRQIAALLCYFGIKLPEPVAQAVCSVCRNPITPYDQKKMIYFILNNLFCYVGRRHCCRFPH